MTLKFKNNMFLITTTILLFTVILLKNHTNFLDSAIFNLKILNMILSILSLNCIFIIYLNNKNSIILILSLIYFSFSLEIILENINYFIFNYENLSFFNYITITTSLLILSLLLVAIFPNSKLHKFICKNFKKAIIFISLYLLVFSFFEIHFKLQYILINKKNLFILFSSFLIILYLYISYKLLKLSKFNNFILRYFSISIFLLALKLIYEIYGIIYMDSNITFLSAFLISIFFLISILAIESSLHMTTINYNSLNTELIKFFNLVENNKYSNMFICDYNINIFYVNKKIKEYYNFQEELTKFKNDLINNKYFYSKLKEIFDDLNNKVYWHGIIKNSIKNELLDCYIQKLNINNKDEFLVSYIVVNNNKLGKTFKNIKLKNLKRNEFISNISHELKTPINIFYSTIQLLENFNNNNNVNFKEIFNKYTVSLKLNCKRMIKLINNIIDLSKIELNSLKPNYGNYNIILLIEDISNSIIPFALSKNLSIKFDTNKEEHYIMCDPIIIERILLNILSNAIKYSKKNSTIYINILVEKSITKISVKDEGCGIDLETQNNIFNRFVRANNSFIHSNEGSGIGLNIVKSLLNTINGDINIKSELNKGSIFEILLPNQILNDKYIKNYKYESTDNLSIELSDIYEIN